MFRPPVELKGQPRSVQLEAEAKSQDQIMSDTIDTIRELNVNNDDDLAKLITHFNTFLPDFCYKLGMSHLTNIAINNMEKNILWAKLTFVQDKNPQFKLNDYAKKNQGAWEPLETRTSKEAYKEATLKLASAVRALDEYLYAENIKTARAQEAATKETAETRADFAMEMQAHVDFLNNLATTLTEKGKSGKRQKHANDSHNEMATLQEKVLKGETAPEYARKRIKEIFINEYNFQNETDRSITALFSSEDSHTCSAIRDYMMEKNLGAPEDATPSQSPKI